MKPTSLLLLFAATTLAVPKASVSNNSITTPAIVTASSLLSTPTSSARPISTPTSQAGILSNVQSAACTRIKEATAGTISQIARLKAEGISVPPFLSGYVMAAQAAEAKLGCVGK